jgi:cyclophilin family peptidyl-prolyl cis-trans isomerase
LRNNRGTIAMARTNAVHSATSQFFINVVDNDFLNHRSPDPQGFGYCVFGRVVKGMETVDAIRAVPTGSRGMHQNVPSSPVVILSVAPVQ